MNLMRGAASLILLRMFPICLLLLGLNNCEETLPAYEMPDAVFQARVIASDLVVDPTLGVVPSGVEFAVDVMNILDPYNQYTLNPPFDVEISISVFIESEPNRKRTVESHKQIDEFLEPGETIRLFLPFPMTDSNGHPWSWDGGATFRQRFLILIGIVHIPQVGSDGIDIPTNRIKIRFYNPMS